MEKKGANENSLNFFISMDNFFREMSGIVEDTKIDDKNTDFTSAPFILDFQEVDFLKNSGLLSKEKIPNEDDIPVLKRQALKFFTDDLLNQEQYHNILYLLSEVLEEKAQEHKRNLKKLLTTYENQVLVKRERFEKLKEKMEKGEYEENEANEYEKLKLEIPQLTKKTEEIKTELENFTKEYQELANSTQKMVESMEKEYKEIKDKLGEYAYDIHSLLFGEKTIENIKNIEKENGKAKDSLNKAVKNANESLEKKIRKEFPNVKEITPQMVYKLLEEREKTEKAEKNKVSDKEKIDKLAKKLNLVGAEEIHFKSKLAYYQLFSEELKKALNKEIEKLEERYRSIYRQVSKADENVSYEEAEERIKLTEKLLKNAGSSILLSQSEGIQGLIFNHIKPIESKIAYNDIIKDVLVNKAIPDILDKLKAKGVKVEENPKSPSIKSAIDSLKEAIAYAKEKNIDMSDLKLDIKKYLKERDIEALKKLQRDFFIETEKKFSNRSESEILEEAEKKDFKLPDPIDLSKDIDNLEVNTFLLKDEREEAYIEYSHLLKKVLEERVLPKKLRELKEKGLPVGPWDNSSIYSMIIALHTAIQKNEMGMELINIEDYLTDREKERLKELMKINELIAPAEIPLYMLAIEGLGYFNDYYSTTHNIRKLKEIELFDINKFVKENRGDIKVDPKDLEKFRKFKNKVYENALKENSGEMVNLRSRAYDFFNLYSLIYKIANKKADLNDIDYIFSRMKNSNLKDKNVEKSLKAIKESNIFKGSENDIRKKLNSKFYYKPDEYARVIKNIIVTNEISNHMIKSRKRFLYGMLFGYVSMACFRNAILPSGKTYERDVSVRFENCLEKYRQEQMKKTQRIEGLVQGSVGQPYSFITVHALPILIVLRDFQNAKLDMVNHIKFNIENEVAKRISDFVVDSKDAEEMDKKVKDFLFDKIGVKVEVQNKDALILSKEIEIDKDGNVKEPRSVSIDITGNKLFISHKDPSKVIVLEFDPDKYEWFNALKNEYNLGLIDYKEFQDRVLTRIGLSKGIINSMAIKSGIELLDDIIKGLEYEEIFSKESVKDGIIEALKKGKDLVKDSVSLFINKNQPSYNNQIKR